MGLRKRLTRGERASERAPHPSQHDNEKARPSECQIEAKSERVCGVGAGVGGWGAGGGGGEETIDREPKQSDRERASERSPDRGNERESE